jgi:hypothetical protein
MASDGLSADESLQLLKNNRTQVETKKKTQYDALSWYDKAGLQLVGA